MAETNRKPPDELADVRERIKELGRREDQLKADLIAGKADLVGDEYVAVISKVTSERIDSKKLRQEIGTERLRPFLVPSVATVVKVEKMRAEDADG